MTERLVVIGGDAAGMSAASVAKRTAGDAIEVVVIERTHDVSYSACGIPYWISGDVSGADKLVARTAAEHRRNGIDVWLGTEATEIDPAKARVRTRGGDGSGRWLGYDTLLIATGAVPRRPPLPGIDAPGIHGVQTLADGHALMAWLEDERPRCAVVVGAGYIGIEMAEACLQRGLTVTVVDTAPEPMTTLDPALGRLVREAMHKMGITVLSGSSVQGFETGSNGRVRAVRTDNGVLPADLVVLGLGVRPLTDLAAASGLELGKTGGLRTDAAMRLPGYPQVYAAGDCVESWDRVSASWVHVPLGTHANKQGRVAGLNIAGVESTFPGIVRTAVSKVCDLEIARTGLRESDARELGRDVAVATIETTTRAGYFPGAQPMTVRMLADRSNRRLLGAQIVGREGAAIRIDVCALALWTQLSVDDLVMTDLSYAPPFSSVWDPVQVAARAVVSELT
ncbi:MAG: FAD-dependent oxidoreductase [Nocardioidaceae bacterium]|nr:FAD-dependent oxidoreductase [Nocardioidaceae bacterium]